MATRKHTVHTRQRSDEEVECSQQHGLARANTDFKEGSAHGHSSLANSVLGAKGSRTCLVQRFTLLRRRVQRKRKVAKAVTSRRRARKLVQRFCARLIPPRSPRRRSWPTPWDPALPLTIEAGLAVVSVERVGDVDSKVDEIRHGCCRVARGIHCRGKEQDGEEGDVPEKITSGSGCGWVHLSTRSACWSGHRREKSKFASMSYAGGSVAVIARQKTSQADAGASGVSLL
jgi:hypothetical protein